VKDPDTGKRRQVLRPRGEWIVRDDESLRIVPQATWDAVKHRQHVRQAEVGDKIRKGIKKGCGRAPPYAFSTLIKCEVCGSYLVMDNQRAYICSGYVNGRICTNNVRVRRDVLESRLTESIQRDLLRDEVWWTSSAVASVGPYASATRPQVSASSSCARCRTSSRQSG
jgi:hypothetical protein